MACPKRFSLLFRRCCEQLHCEIRYWAPHRQVIQMGKLTVYTNPAMLEMAKMMESYVMVVNYSALAQKDKSLLDDLVSLKFDTVWLWTRLTKLRTLLLAPISGCSKLVLSSNQCPKCYGDIKQHAQFSGSGSVLRAISTL